MTPALVAPMLDVLLGLSCLPEHEGTLRPPTWGPLYVLVFCAARRSTSCGTLSFGWRCAGLGGAQSEGAGECRLFPEAVEHSSSCSADFVSFLSRFVLGGAGAVAEA